MFNGLLNGGTAFGLVNFLINETLNKTTVERRAHAGSIVIDPAVVFVFQTSTRLNQVRLLVVFLEFKPHIAKRFTLFVSLQLDIHKQHPGTAKSAFGTYFPYVLSKIRCRHTNEALFVEYWLQKRIPIHISVHFLYRDGMTVKHRTFIQRKLGEGLVVFCQCIDLIGAGGCQITL